VELTAKISKEPVNNNFVKAKKENQFYKRLFLDSDNEEDEIEKTVKTTEKINKSDKWEDFEDLERFTIQKSLSKGEKISVSSDMFINENIYSKSNTSKGKNESQIMSRINSDPNIINKESENPDDLNSLLISMNSHKSRQTQIYSEKIDNILEEFEGIYYNKEENFKEVNYENMNKNEKIYFKQNENDVSESNKDDIMQLYDEDIDNLFNSYEIDSDSDKAIKKTKQI
jgi:hypothetical protein